MNLILFEQEEVGRVLSDRDERIQHLLTILKNQPGDSFNAGIVEGPLGRARLLARTDSGWKWEFQKTEQPPPPLRPLTLILGCPRPPTARRLLKDCSSLGIQEIRACSTDMNEKSYMGSRLWRDGLWKKALKDGAMQGCSTLLPHVIQAESVSAALSGISLQHTASLMIALDNEEHLPRWGTWRPRQPDYNVKHAVLAVGPERGWSPRERIILEENGFTRLHLGNRVLRTETACILGAGLLLDLLQQY